jgi:hypothetical protein
VVETNWRFNTYLRQKAAQPPTLRVEGRPTAPPFRAFLLSIALPGVAPRKWLLSMPLGCEKMKRLA